MNKPRVLMIGPGRNVMGGVSTVINNYYSCGIDKAIDISYLPTMKDGKKIVKFGVAIKAYILFIIQLKRYDIVHVHMSAQASFDRKSIFIKRAYRAGKKIIIHEHAADFDRYFYEQINEKKRGKIKKIFAMADKIIVLSEEWAKFFSKNVCDKEKIIVLHNGVIMPRRVKKDYGNHNVLMFGRLGERKGTYDLLKAIPTVIHSIPDVVFYLGGDGDIEQCKKIVTEKKLDEHVVFLGWVKNNMKEQFFKNCSTFILPSHNEGMPMSVLEAMSYGLATISTNVGGIPQIITNGENGILISPGDSKTIATTLNELLNDEKKKEYIGKNAVKKISAKFDASKGLKKLLELYRNSI